MTNTRGKYAYHDFYFSETGTRFYKARKLAEGLDEGMN